MRVLVVADIPGWVFDRFAKTVQKYSRHCIEIEYGRRYRFDHRPYDRILWLVDVRPDKLRKLGIPPEKVIYAVRSDVFRCKYSQVFERPEKIRGLAKKLLAPNQVMYEKLRLSHDNVTMFEGGVDTDLFRPSITSFRKPPIVGWAGSVAYFGTALKGTEHAEKACQKALCRWYPAIKEDYNRTLMEMVKYYRDIDIYVDLSSSAGRQNGLLEAMASGKLVFTTNVGVAPELIQHGRNGYIVTRNSLAEHLRQYGFMQEHVQSAAAQTVQGYWSWKSQVQRLDKIFEEL